MRLYPNFRRVTRSWVKKIFSLTCVHVLIHALTLVFFNPFETRAFFRFFAQWTGNFFFVLRPAAHMRCSGPFRWFLWLRLSCQCFYLCFVIPNWTYKSKKSGKKNNRYKNEWPNYLQRICAAVVRLQSFAAAHMRCSGFEWVKPMIF